MITNTWILLTAFFLPNDQYEYYSTPFPNKEQCVQMARQTWRNYYSNPRECVTGVETICRNRKNHYDFVRIECDKYGICKL